MSINSANDTANETVPTPLVLRFKKLTKNSTLPSFAYPGDACFDLYSAMTVEIPARQSAEVGLGIASEVPSGYEVVIRGRSGLAVNSDIMVHIGTIDSGYRGPWVVKLFNLSNKRFVVGIGDRIAQGALRLAPAVEIVEAVRLTPSPRGERGLGSSGMN